MGVLAYDLIDSLLSLCYCYANYVVLLKYHCFELFKILRVFYAVNNLK